MNFNHLVNLAVTHLTKLETKQPFSLTLKLIKGEENMVPSKILQFQVKT